MKRIVIGLLLVVFTLATTQAWAGGPKWPDKGWHKGPYLTANVGMMQVTNDKHAVTGRRFNGAIDPAFGITFGWDIADWIGPMLQINFGTTRANAGDPNNNVARRYGAFNFPANTFPVQGAREYALDFALYAKATLPYFIRAPWQGKNFKFIPSLKFGGIGHGLFVNANNNNNKIGAYGGGIAVGAVFEFFLWKGFMFAIDATEKFVWQQAEYATINDVGGTPRRLKILEDGMKPQFSLMGMFGWHF